MTGSPIRVLVVDDDALMRAGLRSILSVDEGIDVWVRRWTAGRR